jgi:hypothetical protein
MTAVDRHLLRIRLAEERGRFVDIHPRSAQLAAQAKVLVLK